MLARLSRVIPLLSKHNVLTHGPEQWACLQPKEEGLPTTAYYAKDEIREVCVSSMLCKPLPCPSFTVFKCSRWPLCYQNLS